MDEDRVLTLYKECSIIRGMMDNKVIPTNVCYPVSIFVNKHRVLVTDVDDIIAHLTIDRENHHG